MKAMYDIYNTVYSEFKPRDVSQQERHDTFALTETRLEFTYGEVIFEHYYPLMKMCEPKEGDIFWDIGCGGAKPVAIAAMMFP